MRPTLYWFLNIVCAVLLLVLLGAHMGLMHLDALLASVFGTERDPLAWNNMLRRGRSMTFTISYVVLLAAALFHGLYGLRTMLLEYFTTAAAARRITLACWLAGLVLFAVGTVATVTFGLLAPGA